MVTSRGLALLSLVFASCGAQSREALSDVECAAAAASPPISGPRAAAEEAPGDLDAQYRLADAWSEAGCFNDAVRVLSVAANRHPGNRELATRLRVARSVVGEEHFFDNLDRAADQARIKRNAFRCDSLQDVQACNDILRSTPDDPRALTSLGDALSKAGRREEARDAYRRAALLAPALPNLNEKLAALEAQIPPNSAQQRAEHGAPDPQPARLQTRAPVRRVARMESNEAQYSNVEPEAQSH